jgi:type VI secretion system secreted protein VgrG
MTYLNVAVPEALLGTAQTNRLLRLSFPQEDGPRALMLANRLDATEGLSRDFRFTVEVLSNDASIPLTDVQGRMVTISLVREDGSLRYFNGYVFEFQFVKTDGGHAYYRMQLAPWMAYLRLRRDYYLFHSKTVQQQTTDIFNDYPVADWQARIHGEDAGMTDACQAAESDYNYLHRRWDTGRRYDARRCHRRRFTRDSFPARSRNAGRRRHWRLVAGAPHRARQSSFGKLRLQESAPAVD